MHVKLTMKTMNKEDEGRDREKKKHEIQTANENKYE